MRFTPGSRASSTFMAYFPIKTGKQSRYPIAGILTVKVYNPELELFRLSGFCIRMPLIDLRNLFVLAALWGSSFLFMRVAIDAFGPVPLIAMRVGIRDRKSTRLNSSH